MYWRRRAVVLLGVLAGLVLLVAVLRQSSEPAPADLPLDAWAPYWAADTSVDTLPVRADQLREVSPFWYAATAVDEVGPVDGVPSDLTDRWLDEARSAGVPIVPSIVDAMAPGGMASVLADPDQRSRHVEAIARLAQDLDADGIDLDYEQFAFADDRSTWPTTRPAWVAFVDELGQRLHAEGRTLTVSVPPVYDDDETDASGYWVYAHADIAPLVDRLRIMAYDYSTAEPGPIAPLDWVRRAVAGTKAATRDADNLVLGIPLYGYNWPTSTQGTCPAGIDTGRTAVTIASVDQLAATRGATPVYDEATAEWSFRYEVTFEDGTTSCTQQRVVHYVDADGARARIDVAREARLSGSALWALGYDDPTLWAAIEPVVRTPDRFAPAGT